LPNGEGGQRSGFVWNSSAVTNFAIRATAAFVTDEQRAIFRERMVQLADEYGPTTPDGLVAALMSGLFPPEGGVAMPKMAVAGMGMTVLGDEKVAPAAKPALPEWFTALPCGQRLVLILIGLSVLLSLDLPPEARDYVAYLIGVFSAAVWVGSKVVKR